MGVPALAPTANSAVLARALQLAGPQTLPLLQSDAMINDALHEQVMHGGQNIRSPLALGSNLLGTLLLSLAANKADKDMAAHMAADQDSIGKLSMNWAPSDAASPSPAGAPTAPPPAAGPDAPQTAAPAPGAAPAPTVAASVPQAPSPASYQASPEERDRLGRLLIAEGGDSPEDEAGVASVALNRAIKSGRTLSDVIAAPHQFEAYDRPNVWKRYAALPANDPHLVQALGVADDVLDNGPKGSWTNFYSPGAQAALGRPKPGWDNGMGQQIGKQLFFDLGGKQGAAPAPMQLAAGPGPNMPAQSGPTGGQMMPVSNPGASPSQPPASSAPPPQAGGAASYMAPPHGLAPTPDEMRTVQTYLHSGNPMMFQQGLEMAQKLRERYLTPPDPDKNVWDPRQGRYVPQPGMGFTNLPGSPNSFIQQDSKGQIHAAANPAFGAMPQGMVMSPNGQAQRVPGTGLRPLTPQERTQWGIGPADRNVYGMNEATGKPEQVAAGTFQDIDSGTPGVLEQRGPNNQLQAQHNPAFGEVTPGMRLDHSGNAVPIPNALAPQQRADMAQKIQGTKEYQEYTEALTSFRALQEIARLPGGVSAYAMKDLAARGFNPNAIARQQVLDSIERHFGHVPQLQFEVTNWLDGNGKLPPQVADQVITAMGAMTGARYKALQPQIAPYQAIAQAAGVPLDQVVPNVAPPIADRLPPPSLRVPGVTTAWTKQGEVMWTGKGWRKTGG